MVLPKTKHLTKRLPALRRRNNVLTPQDVQAARKYIADYWTNLTRIHPEDDETLLGLPHPYLVPSYDKDNEFDYNELYYWDSYFMVQGLMDAEHKELVMGILDNLITMFKRFKIIPNASRLYMTSRTQPPFLTAFIFDVYHAYKPGKVWLKKNIAVAKEEYQIIWMGTHKPNARQIHEGLSRYYDFNFLHDLAEAESGWDMTPRFNRKALNYLPVDLNALLYKYEKDFAYAARLLGNEEEAKKWDMAADHRRLNMNKLMWSELKGLYYDYNFIKKRRGSVSSLASYYPMWAGMIDEEQAAKLVHSIKKFEHKGGLATTDAPQVSNLVPGGMPTQWAYPNGWAPLHFLVAKGLRKYGYEQEAREIAMKWLKTNLDWFNKHGVFLEKYNVVQPNKPPVKGIYPSQTGFGWTNSVFEYFCKEFIDGRE